jgi:hypothetical protein
MSLERRYRLLLRAYPPAYRAAEITGTYLDLAGPGRRWPAPGDVADVLRGGLRERLRASGAHDAAAGVRLAATVALAASAALAIWQLLLRSLPGQVPLTYSGMVPPRLFGPFANDGAVPDAAWVLAAWPRRPALPGRPGFWPAPGCSSPWRPSRSLTSPITFRLGRWCSRNWP